MNRPGFLKRSLLGRLIDDVLTKARRACAAERDERAVTSSFRSAIRSNVDTDALVPNLPQRADHAGRLIRRESGLAVLHSAGA